MIANIYIVAFLILYFLIVFITPSIRVKRKTGINPYVFKNTDSAHGFLQSFDPIITVCSAGTQASGKLNQKAVAAMKDAGIDISQHTSDSVDKYLKDEWDYVITVCGGANEECPAFFGKVKHRLHIGFDDPSHAEGTEEFIWSEFIRVRDEIKEGFYKFYIEQIKPQL